MRLTITGIASQYIHMPLAPACLRRAVEEQQPGIPVTLCDLNINETPSSLLDRLMQTQPDAVAFCVYIWNRTMTAQLIRSLKALEPGILVIVGGPEVTHDPEGFMA